MIFKELKEGYPVYVFNKNDMACTEAKVISVSVPRFDNKMGQTPTMVVDVTLDVAGKNLTYVFPESSTKAYNGNLTFCINKQDVIADVKVIQKASEQILSDIDKHKQLISQCGTLLAELDTEEKAKQEMEHRLGKMAERFDTIEALLKQIAQK